MLNEHTVRRAAWTILVMRLQRTARPVSDPFL